MALPYSPDSRATFFGALAPVLRRAYPVIDANGNWVWSSAGPPDAVLVTTASDNIAVDPAGTVNEFIMVMDEDGAVEFMGEA